MWMTASAPCTARSTAARSRMSPSTNETRRSRSAAATLLCVPRERLSKMMMRPGEYPFSRASIVVDPISPAPPVTTIVAWSIFMLERSPSADQPRRHTGDDRHRLDVMRDDGARTDDGATADAHAGQNDGVHTDVGRRLDDHRLDFEICGDDRHVGRQGGMSGPQHLGTRTPADGVLDHKVPRVEIRLRADPGVVANLATAVEAALDDRLLSDEDAAADRERFRVLEHDAARDLHAVAEGAGERAEDRAAHHCVEL